MSCLSYKRKDTISINYGITGASCWCVELERNTQVISSVTEKWNCSIIRSQSHCSEVAPSHFIWLYESESFLLRFESFRITTAISRVHRICWLYFIYCWSSEMDVSGNIWALTISLDNLQHKCDVFALWDVISGCSDDPYFVTKTSPAGDPMRLKCSRRSEGNVFWMRIVEGKSPEVFRETSQNIRVKKEPGELQLLIIKAELKDSAVYICLRNRNKIVEVLNMTYLKIVGKYTKKLAMNLCALVY